MDVEIRSTPTCRSESCLVFARVGRLRYLHNQEQSVTWPAARRLFRSISATWSPRGITVDRCYTNCATRRAIDGSGACCSWGHESAHL